MNRLFFIIMLLLSVLDVQAQDVIDYQTIDSAYLSQLEETMIRMEKERQAKKIIEGYEQRMLKRELSFNTTGALQLVSGLILSGTNSDFRSNAPKFTDRSNDWRDYVMAGLPAAATYVAKFFGAESRSTTARLFTSTAMGFALSAGLSSGMKAVINERRPDWSDNHSMPSRHTALAFTAATILHREYGYISPWISVGSYATASATQFMRLKDNAHWLSDLYVGAAVGTISANLGYFLTDKIFGEDGIAVKPKVTEADMQRAVRFEECPTSFCTVAGNEFGLGEVLECERTYFVGGEFSYFFNEFVAAEGIAKVSSTKVSEIQDNLLMYHADAAVKVSYPLMPGFRVNGRALAGGRFSEKNAVLDGTGIEMGCGMGFDFLDREKFAVGLMVDYYHAFSDIMKNRLAVSATCRVLL